MVLDTFDTEVETGRVLTMPTDGTGLAILDPWLDPFKDDLRTRLLSLYNYLLIIYTVLDLMLIFYFFLFI